MSLPHAYSQKLKKTKKQLERADLYANLCPISGIEAAEAPIFQ